MALNLCKATESHWKRNCASLSSVETEVILWPRSFKELHSRFVDWAQSFQSNRLEHVRPWQCGVPAVFVWLRIAIIDYYYYHHRHHHHSTTSTTTQLPPPRRLYAVMWSETVGLRTRPVWDQKKSVLVLVLHAVVLVLVLQVWCSVVKHGLVTLVVINDLEGHGSFLSTIIL